MVVNSRRVAALVKTVQQSQDPGPLKLPLITTLARFGCSGSWRATVTRIRALKVATLAPFHRFTFGPVSRLARACNSHADSGPQGRHARTVCPFSILEASGRLWRLPEEVSVSPSLNVYIQTPDRPPQRLLLVIGDHWQSVDYAWPFRRSPYPI